MKAGTANGRLWRDRFLLRVCQGRVMMTKQAGKTKAKRPKGSALVDPKQPADPPVKPIKTRIGRGTTRTPRTLPATGE